jgi:hypothetical protein
MRTPKGADMEAEVRRPTQPASTILWLLTLLILVVMVTMLWIALGRLPLFALQYSQPAVTCKQQGAPAPAGQGSPDVVVYTNRTGGAKDVTGDLGVKANTCSVEIVYGRAGGDRFAVVSDPRKDVADSSTVTVAAGQSIRIHCLVTERRDKCEWNWERTDVN